MLRDLDWTGERLVPQLQGNITYEHIHRYALAMEMAKDKVVLDIACGEGYGSQLLAQVASEVIGVDIAPEVIAHAQSAYAKNNLSFRVGSCWGIPVASQSIDVVVSFETLEHHDQHQEMMRECKRVLRPDGMLIISTPDKHNYTDMTGVVNAFHVRELYLRDFEELLKGSFQRVEIFGQRIHHGSLIAPLTNLPNAFITFKGQFSSVQREPGLSGPWYFIAVASDRDTLPEIPAGSFESKELLTDLQQALGSKDNQIQYLAATEKSQAGELTKQKSQIEELTERERRLAAELEGALHRLAEAEQKGQASAGLLAQRENELKEGNQRQEQFIAETQAVRQKETCDAVRIENDLREQIQRLAEDKQQLTANLEHVHAVLEDTEKRQIQTATEHTGLMHDLNRQTNLLTCQLEEAQRRLAEAEKLRESQERQLTQILAEKHTLSLEFERINGLLGEAEGSKRALQDVLAHATQAKDQTASECQILRAHLADREQAQRVALEAARRKGDCAEELYRSLQKALEQHKKRLDEADALSRKTAYKHLILRIRDIVDRTLPADTTVVVVSRGDVELLRFQGRKGLHFPQTEDGTYAGHHPAESAQAINHLEFLRSKGARFLLFPNTAFWWMSHYTEFKKYLDVNYIKSSDNEDCIIYDLSKRDRHEPEQTSLTAKSRQNGAIHVNGNHNLKHLQYAQVIADVHKVVEIATPRDATILVVSRGDNRLLELRERRGWHFPQTETGVYAGEYPADSAQAIAQIETLREKGGQFLLFPNTAFWWLDHYQDFRCHLDLHYAQIQKGHSCLLFELTKTGHSNGHIAKQGNSHRRDEDQPFSSNRLNIGERSIEFQRNLVTVIVPIYNAFDDVQRCLESLVEFGKHPHQVLLIDDCSSDGRIWPLLQSFSSRHKQFKVIRNESNLGYTATVNKGCRLAPADVILLNSDTEVTANWIEKLAACAASAENIGTVTPLSNSAGAFSVPINNQTNYLPEHVSISDMAALVDRLSFRVYPRVPTGNGFCLYITRSALNRVGLFDEQRFPRGYGEENDLCMRIAAAGMDNIIDDSTYIYHKESRSFRESKTELITRAMSVLQGLYPTYHRLVADWLANDPLDPFRHELKGALGASKKELLTETERDNRPCLLTVVLDGDGGTLLMAKDLNQAVSREYRCLLLTTGLDCWTLYEYFRDGLGPCRKYFFPDAWQLHQPLNQDRIEVVREICRSFHVSVAHVHHLIGNGPELVETLHALQVPLAFSFHDFYTICPTIQLLDDAEKFCGGSCTSGNGECSVAPNLFRGEIPVLKHHFVHKHRARIEKAIQHCTSFIAPSQTTKNVLMQNFPFLRHADFKVIEHGRAVIRSNAAVSPQKGRRTIVLCLGNLGEAKGLRLIRNLMDLDDRRGPNFEFHFLGKTAHWFKPESYGGVSHGPYCRQDLEKIVRGIGPSFSMIASIWPETFCYTLTESWALGLPVFASDIGTLKERIEKHGGGWLLDYQNPENWYQGMIRVLDMPQLYAEQLEKVSTIAPKSVSAMAEEYKTIFSQLLAVAAK